MRDFKRGTDEPEMDEDHAEELIETQAELAADVEEAEEATAEVAVELAPEPTPEPPPCFEPTPEVNMLCWEAFNKGIDAMVRMSGMICNKGHRRLMAQKQGVWAPKE